MAEVEPGPRTGPPDLVKFVLAVLAIALVILSVFLFVRARQMANANDKYQACLAQVRSQENPPGFQPEDVCQKPG